MPASTDAALVSVRKLNVEFDASQDVLGDWLRDLLDPLETSEK